MERRTFITKLLAGSVALLLMPKILWAAVWNKPAFVETKLGQAMKALDIQHPKQTDQIIIKAPDRAENGSIVQVEITSKLANTESITILVEKNPTPLIATYKLSPAVVGHVITRIKMADTSDITAVVKAGGKHYLQRKNVVVLESGCG